MGYNSRVTWSQLAWRTWVHSCAAGLGGYETNVVLPHNRVDWAARGPQINKHGEGKAYNVDIPPCSFEVMT